MSIRNRKLSKGSLTSHGVFTLCHEAESAALTWRDCGWEAQTVLIEELKAYTVIVGRLVTEKAPAIPLKRRKTEETNP